jgi:DNA-directed RNA polymerase subunit RPC12/RpoP
MNEETVEFNCHKCYHEFVVNIKDVTVILHEASPCVCEYCGWGEWTEYRSICPNCGEEVDDI